MKKFLLILLGLALCTAFTGCDEKEADNASKFNVLTRQVNKDNAAAENIVVMVEASSDVEWEATVPEADAEWLMLVKSTGKGNGRLIFTLAENNRIDRRSSSVTVTGYTRSGQALPAPPVAVTQLGAAPAILIEPSGSVTLSSDAVGAWRVEVTANLEWAARVEIHSGEAGWITLTAPSGPFTGSGEAVLSIAENPTGEPREATLRISYTADPAVSRSVSIVQLRAPAQYDLTIEGMDGTLPAGSATLLIAPASAEQITRTGSVVVADGNTSISYDEILSEGEYTLVSVTPEGGSAIFLDGRFTIGEEGVCTAVETWNPAFESFGGESAEHPLRIGKPSHLANLAAAVNGGNDYAGYYFRQTADISLAEFGSWPGIGSAACKFAGSYDGDGKVVSGMSVISEAPELVEGVTCGHALFRHVGGADAEHPARICNLTVSGTATGAAGYVAGIVSRCADFTLIGGCENQVALTASASGPGNVGGIVSVVLGSGVRIENCVNRGEITAQGSGAVNNLGGIAGQADGVSQEGRVLVTGCRNYAKITYQGNSGGIVGTTMGNIDLSCCANYGEMVKTGTTVVRIGGVVGSFQGDVTLRESFNLGRIDGYRQTGGVVGWCQNTGTVENCYNRAEIVAQGSTGNTGGIVGNINTAGFVVKNCYNSGQFTQFILSDANRYAAIAGSGGSNTSGVGGCYYEAGKGMAGGLGRGAKNAPVDAAGQAEQKPADWFTAGAAFDGWDTSLWNFSAGQYPTLANNPERP